MKNVMKLVLLAIFALGGTAVMAQQVKLGYINSQELLAAMPERDSAITKIQSYAAELESQLEVIQVELNNKMQDYNKNFATYTDAIKAMKESELQSLNQRLQESNQIAQQDLERMQTELFNPVLEKLYDAIDKAAKSNGITAVFDTANGAMLYHDESTMVNVMPLAKKELGIAN